MLCKNFSRFFVMLAVPVIILYACFGAFSIEANADSFQVTKVTAANSRAFYGDSLNVSYTQNGTILSTTADYYTSLSSTAFGSNLGENILGDLSNYDVLVYTINWSSFSYTVNDISISGLDTYFPDYFRMGVAISSHDNNITASYNAIVSNTNYWGSFESPCANYSASANLANYYGMLYPPQIQGYAPVLRPIFISGNDGGFFDTVHFNSVKPNSYGSGARSWLYIFCPYTGSTMSSSAPVETTTPSGGQTIINNNVDMTETNGILGTIASAITNAVTSIINGIKNIFVPSDEFMEDFGDELDAIKARFEWSEEIKDIGADFKDILQNQENASAPVVVLPRITNSKDNTVYTTGGENVLDLGEFETEVIIVRGILAVLLWVFFLWRLYARLPEIINGSGMIVGDGTRIMNELDERNSQEFYNDMDNHHIDNLK